MYVHITLAQTESCMQLQRSTNTAEDTSKPQMCEFKIATQIQKQLQVHFYFEPNIFLFEQQDYDLPVEIKF